MTRVALALITGLVGVLVVAAPAQSGGGGVALRVYDPTMKSKSEVRMTDIVRSSARASRGLRGSGCCTSS
jgi:hypothetical protein